MSNHSLIRQIIKSSCYPLWLKNTQCNQKFLTFRQANPLFRILMTFSSDIPNLETSDWVDLVGSVTAIFLFERQVVASLSSHQRKRLLFTVAKLGYDISIKCQYEATPQPEGSPFLRCRQMMLCSFLSLWELNKMSLSSTESKLVHLHLTNLATQVKTPGCGATLLHVICDLQHIFDMKVEGEKYYDRSGHRSITVNSPNGKPFLFVPCAEYMKWAIQIGGADPNCVTKTGYSILDWFFEWFSQEDDNWHLVKYKHKLIDMIDYLMDVRVESVVDPNQVIHILNQSYTM